MTENEAIPFQFKPEKYIIFKIWPCYHFPVRISDRIFSTRIDIARVYNKQDCVVVLTSG